MKKIINLLKKLYKKLDKNIENNLEKKFKDWKNEIRKNKKLNKEHFLSQKNKYFTNLSRFNKREKCETIKNYKEIFRKRM